MAEYYAVLSRAIAGLATASPDTRRAVYDKARNALVGQLRAIDPPLPTADISRQRLELEEAIRRVEREIQSGVLPPPASRPQLQSSPPPRPSAPLRPPEAEHAPPDGGRRTPQDIFRQAILDAEARGAAAGVERPSRAASRPDNVAGNETADVTPDMDEESPPPLAAEPAMPPAARNLKQSVRPNAESRLAPDYFERESESPPVPRALRPPPERQREVRLGPAPIDPHIEDVAPPSRTGRRAEARDGVAMAEPRPRRSRAPLIILVLILILAGGLGYLGWTQLGTITAIVASFDKPSAKPTATATLAVPAAPADSTKNGDRLLAPGQTAAPPGGPVRVVGPGAGTAPTVTGSNAVPPLAGGAKPPATAPGIGPTGQQASLPPQSSTQPQAPAGPVVTQKATLYEEPTNPGVAASQTLAIAGTVSWSFATGGADGPEVIGTVTIPDRKTTVKVTIRRNTDQSLPASHLVEVLVTTPTDFPGKSVSNVPTMVLKPSEDARGDVLVGASATVAPGYYWIALSNAQQDLTKNIGLLRDREWIDIRLVYQSGQRAILTLEKGSSGGQAFAKALSAWQTG
jgi:hypothetical protein